MKGLEKHMDIRGVKHLQLLSDVGIKKEECLLSCTTALLGIRENHDLDVVIPVEMWSEFALSGEYDQFKAMSGDIALVHKEHKELELYYRLAPVAFDSGGIFLNQMDPELQMITYDGYRFPSLPMFLLWKSTMGRKKDIGDIILVSAMMSAFSEE